MIKIKEPELEQNAHLDEVVGYYLGYFVNAKGISVQYSKTDIEGEFDFHGLLIGSAKLSPSTVFNIKALSVVFSEKKSLFLYPSIFLHIRTCIATGG